MLGQKIESLGILNNFYLKIVMDDTFIKNRVFHDLICIIWN